MLLPSVSNAAAALLGFSSVVSALPKVQKALVHHAPSMLHKRSTTYYSGPVITPKAVIISLFAPEENVWHTAHYGLLAQNISIPGSFGSSQSTARVSNLRLGLSPVYPQMHCNADGSLCQVTTGESGMPR
jgi:purine nucleoside permease